MATTDPGDGAKVHFPPPLIFLVSLLIGIAISRYVLPISIPLARTARIAIGLAVVAAGIAPIAWARMHFFRTKQNPIPWKPTPELIFEGPYLYTRNPMYVGMTLLQIGLGTALDSPWSVVFAPLSLAIVHAVAVKPEEAYLSQKFGDPYRHYLNRVRRYL